MLAIFLDIKGIVHKEFVLAGQTVNPAYYLTFYRDCVKMCEDFTPNFGDERTGCCITTTNRLALLLQGIFGRKRHDYLPHPHYVSVSPIEEKTERPPFYKN
jgi:hypothetical protein